MCAANSVCGNKNDGTCVPSFLTVRSNWNYPVRFVICKSSENLYFGKPLRFMGWTRGLEPRTEPARAQRINGSTHSRTRTGREGSRNSSFLCASDKPPSPSQFFIPEKRTGLPRMDLISRDRRKLARKQLDQIETRLGSG
jgi:hypothetical protein